MSSTADAMISCLLSSYGGKDGHTVHHTSLDCVIENVDTGKWYITFSLVKLENKSHCIAYNLIIVYNIL